MARKFVSLEPTTVLVWAFVFGWLTTAGGALAQCDLFMPSIEYGAGNSPYWVTAGDLDGDGDVDLATANFLSDNVSVLLNNGDGAFAADVLYGTGFQPLSVTAADPVAQNVCVEAKLLPSDGAKGDSFARDYAADVSGDVVIGGAGSHSGRKSGAAYIWRFDGTNWVEEAKLRSSDGWATDHFGRLVAISGDVAVVAAYGDDDNGPVSGSAYVFRFNGTRWIEEAKLLASDGEKGDAYPTPLSKKPFLPWALNNDDLNSLDTEAQDFCNCARAVGIDTGTNFTILADDLGAIPGACAIARKANLAFPAALNCKLCILVRAYGVTFDGSDNITFPVLATMTASLDSFISALDAANQGQGDVIKVGYSIANWEGFGRDSLTSAQKGKVRDFQNSMHAALHARWPDIIVAHYGCGTLTTQYSFNTSSGFGTQPARLFPINHNVGMVEDPLFSTVAYDVMCPGFYRIGDYAVTQVMVDYTKEIPGQQSGSRMIPIYMIGGDWVSGLPSAFDGFNGLGVTSTALNGLRLLGDQVRTDDGFAGASCWPTPLNSPELYTKAEYRQAAVAFFNGFHGVGPADADCPGDANGDGTVDPLDAGYVLARFGCSVGTGDSDCDAADQNGDGMVDPLDHGFVLARFGDCP